MTFQDAVKDIFLANHLGSMFGEQVVFTPESGDAARRIWAVVKPRTKSDDGQSTQAQDDEYEITLGRDPDNATRGGVDILRPGDRVTRSISNDRNEVAMLFSGTIVAQSQHIQTGVFTRAKRFVQGRGQ